MATQHTVTFVSDLSGEPADPDTATVQFALDGTDYEIDLTDGEQSELREMLKPFISAARRSSRADQANTEMPVSNQELRAWAIESGFDLPKRGRIPAPVRDAYDAAHRQMVVSRIERLLRPVTSGRASAPQ